MQFQSLILSKAAGSVGGLTASHNRYGMYLRSRSDPVNPSSQRQQEIRSIFAALATYWSSDLSQAQRDAWNQYGDGVAMINRLGESMFLPGFNHFIRSNTAIVQAGGDQVDPGPVVVSLPLIDSSMAAAISVATQQITVTFDDTMDWCSEDDAYMSIFMALPKSPGVEFVGGPHRFAGQLVGDSGVPIVSPQVLNVPFGSALDHKTVVTARILRADGRVTEPFRDTVTIAA